MQPSTPLDEPSLDPDAPADAVIADLLEAARVQADSVAIAAPDATWTYSELRAQAGAIASQLSRLGVSEGDLVGVCAPPSAGLIATVLGIREIGAAYVAMDPVHPDRRLREMLADSAAVAVVTGPGQATRLGVDADLVPHSRGLEIAALPRRRGAHPARGLAYVVYTSGSTGAPKGVMVTEAGLTSLVQWHRQTFELTASDRCTQLAAPGFDAFAWDVWPCLASGASLHVPPDELRTDPAVLRDWIVANGITVSFLPTTLAEPLLALPWPQDCRLRLLLTGGDRMHRRPPAGLPFQVVNNYGVSEATVVSTSGVVAPGPDDVLITIGRPIGGVQVRIVDEDLNPVPDGKPGELLIGGVSVAAGYLGRPDLTAQRFVRDPYPSSAGDRWYRTGDLARRLADGELAFLGRIDNQVKIRGNRVEPGEVATVLERHPAVVRCVVIPVGEAVGDVSLVAYLRAHEPCSTAELRGFAAQRLPTAMLPAKYVWLDKFPVTANGKIDAAALAERAALEHGAALTGDGIEQTIAELVAEVLDLPEVGPADSFVLLGGDSALAERLVGRIADRFDVELPPRTVFEHPTVVELADQVRRTALLD